MPKRITPISLDKLHSILNLICILHSEYGLKMTLNRGLSVQEIGEKRVLEKSYDLVYEKIKELQ